jgi:hypothetical protein
VSGFATGILTYANLNQQRTAEDGVNLCAVCDWRFARRIMHRLFSGIEMRQEEML